ncbi:23S rRNA (guanosine(2251)-2'-O)-methyltransferase RlmB [Polluticoccus soli]|uniref:23S rRNA (guanosine(2251)-2'-O)-methyltransferase RlmB n=1 Tax=Polluticoccus soli TaxID=3034150 RepID=UPI0023E256DD|nr:23S rRNA (guanosine(2251)-2'-O)-methyltransferase RlmB [Flavipsychrobacter sp. JY13-12]
MKPARSLPILIGRKPLLEALQQGTMIEKIFLLRSATGPEINSIKQLARERNIPISQVPVEKLNNLTKAQHQGVVAWTSLLHYVELQDAIDSVVDKGETPLFVLLDGVTDVRNVGAIARTALCCGAQGIILPTSSSASLTEEAIKTSTGALRKILLCRIPSVQQAIDVLRLNGIQVLGTQMQGAIPVFEADMKIPSCVVMGAEDTGISKDVIKRADTLIKIPMAQQFDSLNVSVATGMILYEAMRQRLLS